MSDRRSMTTKHSDIFEYYKDKCITENGTVEIDVGYDGHDESKANVDNSIPVIVDWGEPCCFACGGWTGVQVDDVDADLKKLWDNATVKRQLQRAHIVPDALGGKDTPTNLFCLCKRCHRDSPDTIYANEFFRWVYNRRKEGTLSHRVVNKAIAECEKRNVNPAFMDLKEVFDNVYKTMGSHGAVIEESSYVAALVGSAMNKYNTLNSLLQANTNSEREKAISKVIDVFHLNAEGIRESC